MYTEADHNADKPRILAALQAVAALRNEFKDVIAIPEIVTLHDITEYQFTAETPFKARFNRHAAQYVLAHFRGVDFITPEEFDRTVTCALQDYNPHTNKE